MLYPNTTINCRSKLLDLGEPKIMGILNVTPDSFYDGGVYRQKDAILRSVDKMIEQGAHIIDVGGMSSRPGAEIIGVSEELKRVLEPLELIRKRHPKQILSIDTVHSQVAKSCLEIGVHIVNDISAGNIDPAILDIPTQFGAPYIMMHMKGKPKDMQQNLTYVDPVLDILDFFTQKVGVLREKGIVDIIIDPGFGFGKSIQHNYQILHQLKSLKVLGLPILAGLSRKSMIYKVLESDPASALNGTTALHMIALLNGADILRVHDVKEAAETIRLAKIYREASLIE